MHFIFAHTSFITYGLFASKVDVIQSIFKIVLGSFC